MTKKVFNVHLMSIHKRTHYTWC